MFHVSAFFMSRNSSVVCIVAIRDLSAFSHSIDKRLCLSQNDNSYTFLAKIVTNRLLPTGVCGGDCGFGSTCAMSGQFQLRKRDAPAARESKTSARYTSKGKYLNS
jgi:hypothetical protein